MTETAGKHPTAEEFSIALGYEWDKLVGYQIVSDPFWREAEAPKIVANMFQSWLNEDVAVRLSWPVAQRKLAQYKWPATWRDAFKERWFPEWAKRRWPVLYREVDLRELYACKRPPEDDRIKYHITERMLADDLPNL